MAAPEADSTSPDPTLGEAFRLSERDATFAQSAVSIIAAAQGLDGKPAIARAIGVLIDADSGRLRIYLRRHDAEALLAGAAAHGQVAVMFSRPTTSESIQVKGDDTAIEPPTPRDENARRRYLPAMIDELRPVGFDAGFVCAMASDYGSPAAILSFAPRVVFDQTPGPRAGEPRPA